MKFKRAIGAALVAGAFVAAPAFATDASNSPKNASSYFDSLDKNNDGKLDSSELASVPAVQRNFSKYDHNKNGSLGKDEFAEAMSAENVALPGSSPSPVAGASSNPSTYFDSLDKNNDGKLDPTEANAVPGLQQAFGKYDHDKNGTLGKDEFREALSAIQASPSAAAGASSNPSKYFDSLDKNNDGKLDPSELAAVPAVQKDFSKYDHDKNGTLGKDEFREALSGTQASPSAAAGGSAAPKLDFDSLDKNKDGKLDPTEAQAVPGLSPNFSKFDHDKNGTLGKDEFKESQGAK